MANIECRTVYFEQPGSANTDLTLRLTKERAEQLGINNIVVASYIDRFLDAPNCALCAGN